MRNRKFWSLFFLVAAALTAAMIFLFSCQSGPESQSLSEEVAEPIARLLRPDYAAMTPAARLGYLKLLTGVIRKLAHFSEFALLGFNLAAHLGLRPRRLSARRGTLTAWGLATLYAATDELHQLFVSQRGPMATDVLIDSAGGLTGALVASLGLWLLARRRRE